MKESIRLICSLLPILACLLSLVGLFYPLFNREAIGTMEYWRYQAILWNGIAVLLWINFTLAPLVK